MLERLRERRGGAENAEVFLMRERLVDIGDDFWIETTGGRRAYKVNGKAVRVRDTLDLETVDGTTVAQIQERKLRIRDSMVIERPGKPDVTVHKAMITPLRERWTFESDDLGEVTIQGNLLDHEYTFQGQGGTIAEVSKRWLRVRDTYGVEVQPGADPVVILAATVALEQMST